MTLIANFEPFTCVAILGVGMMGGSLGLALRSGKLAERVIGIDLNAETLAQAQMMGAIDAGNTDMVVGIRGADCVVIAAPVGAIPGVLAAIAPHVGPETLITDLGSTKAQIVAAGSRLFGPRFVGGHPMAGSERNGIGAASANLFANAAWAIVRQHPFSLAEDAPAARITGLVAALGARPVPLGADQHDRIVALVSHLPHLLSFAYARTIEASEGAEAARSMAGGSFRDMIRVSHADPDLWRDIFDQNRDFLRAALAAYEAELQRLKALYDLS